MKYLILDNICQASNRLMIIRNKKVGSLLREEREKRSLLLRHIASEMNMDQALLSKIERGERNPNKNQIELFAKVFKIDSNELMIAYLSDIVIDSLNDEMALDVLKAAKKKLINKKIHLNVE